MKLSDDDFTLFGLPQRQSLSTRRHSTPAAVNLQAAVHPDRFASEGAAAQRLAMQWAVRVNEAYQRLKDPLGRAAYLCELRGVPVDAERNTAMPAAFLMQQMHWREALEDADDAAAGRQPWPPRWRAEETRELAELAVLLDESGRHRPRPRPRCER